MAYVSARRLPGTRPQTLQLEGRDFEFVTNQRDFKSAIYKSADAYLRIGSADKILRDLDLHKRMEAAGFPVAPLLAEGERNGESYFIEASLGDSHLGDLFGNDVQHSGSISEERFEQLVSVAEKFARAQLTTKTESGDYKEFENGLLLEELCEEMREYADKLRARFALVKERTAALPFVVTHGDFNPNNLYPNGVIDLEDSFYAPYGYDPVSAIVHIDSFPDSEEYEYFAKYRFTPEQKAQYAVRLDTISAEAGLPPLSHFREDFEFCRAVWLAARIPTTPKLQKFRFDFVVEKFLF